MKRRPILLAALIPLCALAFDDYEINVSQKTASEREGEAQELPRMSTKATSRDVFYKIKVRRKAPNVPETVILEWGVMVEFVRGQRTMAEYGTKEVTLPLGQVVELQTGNVMLQGREFDGRFRNSSIEDNIAGYGIRIKDSAGKVVGCKFSPTSIKQDIEQAMEKKEQERKKENVRQSEENTQGQESRPNPPKRFRRRLFP